MKKVLIVGGGTSYHVRPHLSLSAVAYGTAAKKIYNLCSRIMPDMKLDLKLTKMVNCASDIETPQDVRELVDAYVADLDTKIIFFTPAIVDFEGSILIDGEYLSHSGKDQSRLLSNANHTMHLRPGDKIISSIRKEKRKDIFLVGFKTTAGASPDEQYAAGLNLCKKASCNLVLANDVHTRLNMVVCPEEARYYETTDRDIALTGLVEMAHLRSQLTFTRSTVIAGDAVPWSSDKVPDSLRKVVDYCIDSGAYKPFNGITTGHFACKIDDQTFLTSRRKTNFNDLDKIGLVLIKSDGPDSVIAYGSKPSVGGQSQRMIFSDHTDYDCVVHFHCPKKIGSEVPVISQREYECGSHECGQNTSDGLKKFGNLSAVMLDNHGPNIVFHHSVDPQEVIDFIEANFDLSNKTGGVFVGV